MFMSKLPPSSRSQYNLGYISTNAKTDGAWRRIQVLCNRPGLEVRTRNGYYAPRAAPAPATRQTLRGNAKARRRQDAKWERFFPLSGNRIRLRPVA